MKDPIGRPGSPKPERARRTASATAFTASDCPTTRAAKRSSMRTSLARSPSNIRCTGMPVHAATTLAMSSSVTSWRNSAAGAPSLGACFSTADNFCSKPGMRPY